VPVAGVEPARRFRRGILSPLRLPIPPYRRTVHNVTPEIPCVKKACSTCALPLYLIEYAINNNESTLNDGLYGLEN
jgi:hypothetical protein